MEGAATPRGLAWTSKFAVKGQAVSLKPCKYKWDRAAGQRGSGAMGSVVFSEPAPT